jgi:3-deoxy-D-manno-octulosonic-acid transferase
MTFIGAQSEADRDRFFQLGAPRAIVEVAGTTKFDKETSGFAGGPAPAWAGRSALFRRLLPLGPGPLWVLASTHAGEEEPILARIEPLRQRFGRLQLLIAPRHPSRGRIVKRLARRHGLRAVLRTEAAFAPSPGPDQTPPDVIVLDTVGELEAVVGLADLVFVGGSLVDRGGHNPIEAAAQSRAILIGPSTYNFTSVLAPFLAARAVVVVRDAQELVAQAGELLGDPAGRAALGWRAAGVVRRQAGTAGRLVQRLEQIVGVSSGRALPAPARQRAA